MHIFKLFTGAIVFGFLIGGTFFFRFWKSTNDRLFLLFGIAFAMLGVQQLLLATQDSSSESYPLLFTIRLAAFALILIAIADKNIRAKR
jgi:uncharacterized membrane protein YqgA involved in biofilm formation